MVGRRKTRPHEKLCGLPAEGSNSLSFGDQKSEQAYFSLRHCACRDVQTVTAAIIGFLWRVYNTVKGEILTWPKTTRGKKCLINLLPPADRRFGKGSSMMGANGASSNACNTNYIGGNLLGGWSKMSNIILQFNIDFSFDL